MEHRPYGLYEKYIKRLLDICLSVMLLVLLSPILIIVSVLVKTKLGSPVLFTQPRPGKGEVIFNMYKFRSMTDERDENGDLLPDSIRLTPFGKLLRSTSLDELPELFNILKGDMSFVGPRPQLVRDMVFMTTEQRQRHSVRAGLTGLAQVNGRNSITWEDKLNWDLKYVKKVTFLNDLKILFQTVGKVLKRSDVVREGTDSDMDFGDYLLAKFSIRSDDYHQKMLKANEILKQFKKDRNDVNRIKAVKEAADTKKYSVLMSLYVKEKPEYLKMAIESMINQTVAPDEIIVVEDGPLTNELYAVLDEYPMIHRIKNNVNIGLGLALNVGLKECRNELVARMDTDDCSKPNRCEKQLARFSEKPYLVIVGSHIDEFVNDVSNVISQRVVPTSADEIYNFAKRRSAFNHPVVMYSKSAILANNGYSDLKRNQDVELFGRMQFEGYKAENIDDTLLWFRSSDELSKRRKSWQNTWSYIATIRKFWKMGYSSFTDYVIVAVAQTGMYCLPIQIQNFIYKRFLRR